MRVAPHIKLLRRAVDVNRVLGLGRRGGVLRRDRATSFDNASALALFELCPRFRAASCGRRSSASAPVPVSTLRKVSKTSQRSAHPQSSTDTKGYANGCRFRRRNLITIKCADCRICSAQ